MRFSVIKWILAAGAALLVSTGAVALASDAVVYEVEALTPTFYGASGANTSGYATDADGEQLFDSNGNPIFKICAGTTSQKADTGYVEFEIEVETAGNYYVSLDYMVRDDLQSVLGVYATSGQYRLAVNEKLLGVSAFFYQNAYAAFNLPYTLDAGTVYLSAGSNKVRIALFETSGVRYVILDNIKLVPDAVGVFYHFPWDLDTTYNCETGTASVNNAATDTYMQVNIARNNVADRAFEYKFFVPKPQGVEGGHTYTIAMENVHVEVAGMYELLFDMYYGSNTGGIWDVYVNGTLQQTIDVYHPSVPAKSFYTISLGNVALQAGDNEISLVLKGKSDGSSDYRFSIATIYTKYLENLPKHYVTYQLCGGEADIVPDFAYDGYAFTLTDVVPVRSGYGFQGWAVTEGGLPVYAPGESVSLTESIALYAVWGRVFEVRYDRNDGTGLFTSAKKTEGVSLPITMDVPEREGYDFIGWADSPDGETVQYAGGDLYTVDADVTLYAIWQQPYPVFYDANGGSGSPAQTVKHYNVPLTLSSVIPVRDGYLFAGWGLSSRATGAEYAAGALYEQNAPLYLYAVWQADVLPFEVGGAETVLEFENLNITTGTQSSPKNTEEKTVSAMPQWSAIKGFSVLDCKNLYDYIEFDVTVREAGAYALDMRAYQESADTKMQYVFVDGVRIGYQGYKSEGEGIRLQQTAQELPFGWCWLSQGKHTIRIVSSIATKIYYDSIRFTKNRYFYYDETVQSEISPVPYRLKNGSYVKAQSYLFYHRYADLQRGDTIQMKLQVEQTGIYTIRLHTMKAVEHAKLYLDDVLVDADYGFQLASFGKTDLLQQVPLTAGLHTITFELMQDTLDLFYVGGFSLDLLPESLVMAPSVTDGTTALTSMPASGTVQVSFHIGNNSDSEKQYAAVIGHYGQTPNGKAYLKQVKIVKKPVGANASAVADATLDLGDGEAVAANDCIRIFLCEINGDAALPVTTCTTLVQE